MHFNANTSDFSKIEVSIEEGSVTFTGNRLSEKKGFQKFSNLKNTASKVMIWQILCVKIVIITKIVS